MQPSRLFTTEQPTRRAFSWQDIVVLAGLAALIYGLATIALGAPEVVEGPTISLRLRAIPYYATLSLLRMATAYILSLCFTLVYGRFAASSAWGERLLVPLLDVLQSVPILSFLPVVMLSLSAFLSENVAAELASVVLIFTSQVWNMTFAWYQSLKTTPTDLREANAIFRFNGWMRFKTLELPFGSISLIWNSMMSWAGGWFFLIAAETFTVGQKDFSLPGLGSYLYTAAEEGDMRALFWGLAALILIIVALDQFIWRPLLAWADRFKLQMVTSDEPPTSWFYDFISATRLSRWLNERVIGRGMERLDRAMLRRFPVKAGPPRGDAAVRRALGYLLGVAILALLAVLMARAGRTLLAVPLVEWREIGVGLLATLLRVAIAMLLALAWTIPVGVAIGSNPRLARWLQPLVQITASVPATALFPVILIFMATLPGGLNLAAVLLMLLGTQWYLLFNIIAGASTIPQDLKYTSALLRIDRWAKWRTLILPALFSYIITGAITANGGAWNASIVAEHLSFGDKTIYLVGIGGLITKATADGNYPLLFAATFSMVLAVVLINRLLWRPLYRQAEEKYRLD
ncbi:MAG: ABC transporter permease subunit [Anaerolinea sp.]|nr:ABC transporter permease subunit [Anaerolinea sp.]